MKQKKNAKNSLEKAQIICVVKIITALQIIPLETRERLTMLPAHAYGYILSSKEQIYCTFKNHK